MGLDDLLKGLSVFNEGVTQWASSRAINDAQEKLQALNAQEMDRGQLLDAKNQVAQELSLRLGQAGAAPAMIDQLAGQIAPSLGAQFQAESNLFLQQESQAFKAGEAQKEREKDITIEEMKQKKQLEAEDKKRKLQLGSLMTPYQKDYNRLTQKPNESLAMAQAVKDIIASKNPVGDQTVGLFMAKLVQGGSQLSNEEREIFQGSPALLNKAQSIAQKYLSGKVLTDADRKFMIDLADKFGMANQRKLDYYQNTIAEQAFQRAQAQGYSDITKNDTLAWLGTSGRAVAPSASQPGIAKNPNKGQGAAEPQATSTSGGMVKIKGPDGKIRLVPAAQREAALKAGGVEVP